MSNVQVVAICVSVFLLIVVLELVRRRKLVEEYSIVWILGAMCLLGLSIWRGLLDRAAQELGIYYPPSLLLVTFIVAVFVALLFVSVVLSRQRQQIQRLTEEAAILGAELRDLKKKV